jgi:glycosyltransferase involved in cell wall biosynthesis
VVSDKIKEIKPNIFINCVSPLDSSQLIRKACRDMGVKYLTWLQDVYSIATSKVLSNKYSLFGRLIGKYYEFVEAQLLRSSDHIISITKDFVPLWTSWNVKSENISVIPNWANVNEIPFGGKVNPWSIQYDLYDKFCFLYSGTLGFKHNPRILSELALNVIKYSNIKVVVISEGQGADWLNKEKRDKKIQNLIILNFQSFKELPNVLATSDVLISILELEAGLYSVPSKVLTYLCSKRPLLLAVPADNMAARMVLENDMGIVVPPDDDKLFIEAALELYQNEEKRELYGNNARAYAEENFDIKSITNNFIDILDTCITGFKNN